MQKILLSFGMIVFVGALAAGATGAFFSDTETSTGNTFAAGSLDLKVDSESHYNGATCTEVTAGVFQWQGGSGFPVPGTPCEGTWSEADLGASHKFFNLNDVKPGDNGEATISLHVYNNDAWGRFVISNVSDRDNTCTEPEEESVNDLCTVLAPEGATAGAGELAENISFFIWLDQGATPGFQCNDANSQGEGDACTDDPTEGDNVQQVQTEPTLVTPGSVDLAGETHNIWTGLAAVRAAADAVCDAGGDADGNGSNVNDGDYGTCHGLADDGRMVGSVTYYFGLGWNLPGTVGNEAQTDSLTADLTFQVEQHRNNPNPFNI